MDVTRNILFRMDRGLDRFVTTEDITTETGVIAFEMGDSPATDRGPFADKDARPQEVVFDKDAIITAGTDLIVTSKDAGDFRLLATAEVVAGRDILIITEGGRDLFDFDTTISAVRNITVQSGIETDVMMAEGPGAAVAMGTTYEGLLEMFASESAIKRLNEVEDVSLVAVLLASDAGAGITGSLISIDGGTSPY
jgi:hypothetical protein